MNFWLPVLLGSLGTYAEKLLGHLVPQEWLERPLFRRVAEMLPIGLLAALIGYQAFGSGTQLVLDGRVAGLLVAAVLLRFKQNFAVVIVTAAVAVAAGRHFGLLA